MAVINNIDADSANKQASANTFNASVGSQKYSNGLTMAQTRQETSADGNESSADSEARQADVIMDLVKGGANIELLNSSQYEFKKLFGYK